MEDVQLTAGVLVLKSEASFSPPSPVFHWQLEDFADLLFFFFRENSVVKSSELAYPIKFSVYDFDRFSSNDFMATATVPLTAFSKAGGPVEEKEVRLELKKQAIPCSTLSPASTGVDFRSSFDH